MTLLDGRGLPAGGVTVKVKVTGWLATAAGRRRRRMPTEAKGPLPTVAPKEAELRRSAASGAVAVATKLPSLW